MTFDRSRELLRRRAQFNGGCQRNGARMVLAEVARVRGQATADALIRELEPQRVFGFASGMHFQTSGNETVTYNTAAIVTCSGARLP